MRLNSFSEDQLKRMQDKINAERKRLGLPSLSKVRVVEEIIDNVMAQNRVYVGGVFVDL